MQKLKNNETRPKFTASFKRKAFRLFDLQLARISFCKNIFYFFICQAEVVLIYMVLY